tara:strand:- start:701 stop:1252 length:552 start_codon:yes stop_codon:yes gene_type:complete
MKKEIIEWIKAIGFALVIFFILNIFISTTTVYNTSMLPTLIEGDRLVLLRSQSVEKGDIVSFESDMTLSQRDIQSLNIIQRFMVNENTKKNLIKRVIAVPGDTIEIKGGVVFVNDEIVDEPYINTVTNHEVELMTIEEGTYFMMGDNRYVSMDSRQLGPIEGDRIIGKVLVRFFPINRMGTVD